MGLRHLYDCLILWVGKRKCEAVRAYLVIVTKVWAQDSFLYDCNIQDVGLGTSYVSSLIVAKHEYAKAWLSILITRVST